MNKTTWPHLILVANRTAKVKGRITTPMISKTGIKTFNKPEIPIGKKCLIIIITLFLIHNTHKNNIKQIA
jgi:hypothetical protein